MTAAKEILGAIWTILNVSAVQNSGLNPSTGAARVVALFNQPTPNQPVPYVRLTLTDEVVLDGETHDIAYEPVGSVVSFLVDVFSDYEPEVLNISAAVQALLRHVAISTANYEGTTWMESADYFTEQGGGDSASLVYRRASLRFRVVASEE